MLSIFNVTGILPQMCTLWPTVGDWEGTCRCRKEELSGMERRLVCVCVHTSFLVFSASRRVCSLSRVLALVISSLSLCATLANSSFSIVCWCSYLHAYTNILMLHSMACCRQWFKRPNTFPHKGAAYTSIYISQAQTKLCS